MNKGRFITFEGIDGAGKSSHIDWLSGLLREAGKTVVQSREPGGTAAGEKLRALLLHDDMHADTEALLMFAARSEHLAQVIRPARARGDWVISDRFSDATFAYQCGGRGLDETRFAALENWVHPDLQPDLTLLFDLAPDVAETRMNRQVRVLDRFEQEQADFHQRVRAAYLRRAVAFPERFRIIDASLTIDKIRQKLAEIIHRELL